MIIKSNHGNKKCKQGEEGCKLWGFATLSGWEKVRMRYFQVSRNHETMGAQYLNSYENSKFSSLPKVKVSHLWHWIPFPQLEIS